MSSDSEDEPMDLNESSTDSDSLQEDESDSNEKDKDGAKNNFELNESNDGDSDEEGHQEIEESEISSDDEQEDDEESEDNGKDNAAKTVEDKIREKIINRLKGHIGKQLYVRFNARLPEDEAEFQKQAKALSPLIIKAHKPRQKYARFCLVDFETQKDRDAAYVKLRADIKKKEPSLKGIVVSIPRTENEEFVQSLIQKKMKAHEKKVAKARLKRKIKQAKKGKTKSFTSTVLVRNLPGNVSKAEMRSLFPNAVDIQMKTLKANKSSIATITLPSSKDAREAVKNDLSLGGTRLRITFHGGKVRSSNAEHGNAKKDQQNQKEPEKKFRKILST